MNKELFAIHHSSLISSIMYPRPRFLEMLHAIREEMSREADYDMELFAESARTGVRPSYGPARNIRGFRTRAPRADQTEPAPKPVKQRRRATS